MEEKLAYIRDMLYILNNDVDSTYSKKYLKEHNLAYKNILELEKLVDCDKSEMNVNLLYSMVDNLANSLFLAEFIRGGISIVVREANNKQGKGE